MSRYLPPLSLLLPVDKLPSGLDFINTVFSKLYFRNFTVNKSFYNEEAYYNIIIVTNTKIGLNIMGDNGLELLLNPDFTEGNTSEFPMSFSYYCPIIKYIRGFDLSKFDFSISAIYELLLKVAGIDEPQLLKSLTRSLYSPYGDEDEEEDIYQLFIDDFNNKHNPATPIVYNNIYDDDLIADDILLQMSSNGNDYNIIDVIFNDYLTQDDDFGTIESKLEQLFYTSFGIFKLKDISKNLLTPKISASLNNISLALAFPRTWLKPINPATNQPYEDDRKSMLRFNVGALRYSTENGLEFEGENCLSFEKSEIGNTGMTLDFKRMKLDLSRTKNIPEATAAGYPDDFVGVFVESAEIGLPAKWFKSIASNGATLGIFGENLLLGTGGISGKFGLKAMNALGEPIGDPDSDAEMEFKLGGDNGLTIGFKHFDFTLNRGEFVSTNIKGSLQIPGFENASGQTAKVNVSMSFEKDGNFRITASETNGIPIRIPDVLTFNIKSLTVGRAEKNGENKFFISTSGSIEFTGTGLVSQLFADPLEIDQLIIWQDGTIELKGLDGAFKLPKPKTLKLGPADITVTAIHFGTDERMYNNKMRKYWYFGFDGGVSINPGGIDARGDGVKVYFTVDNDTSAGRPPHMFFRIQSLAIDLIIPGSASRESAAVIINGYLSMKEGDTKGTEYIGGISLDLPKLRISASAAMRYNPSVPAYLVDVNLNLPTAIPLGPTGVGIYGFRGLLGQRYVASRPAAGVPENGSWYQYYKAKIAPDYKEGIQVSKFAQKDGFSVGAGVSLATAFDSGKVFSAKVFVMLSLPEILLIQGQGAILRERIGLDTTNDPPFSAMIAISPQSVEAEFGANITIPEGGGEIATVTGTAEMAFFFNNSGSWYLNIGRNQPEDKRVRAEIFTLFNAYFYFMLSKKGIETGAGANWDFKKKLGPLSISAFAYLDVAGKVGFKPVQLGGSIGLGAGASIGIWKLKLGIEVHAFLAAEAPKPFIITGKFSFKLKLPWPIKKLGGPYSLEFTWSFKKERDLSEIQLIDPHNNVKAINRLTGESFAVCYSASEPSDMHKYIIPVDSYIDIEFLKGMKPMGAAETKFGAIGHGANYTEHVPPQKGKSQQVTHEFHLVDIEIWYKSSSGWTNNYDMYEAIRPNPLYPDSIINFPTYTANLKCGHWQDETPGKYNKLRVFAKSSLSYLTTFTSGVPSHPEDFGYKEGFLFCEGQRKPKTCVTFPEVNRIFAQGIFREQQRVSICATGDNGVVRPAANPFNLANALTFGKKIELRFTESKVEVDLRLISHADTVKVKYFRQQHISENSSLTENVLITEKVFTPTDTERQKTISYKHTEHNNLGVDIITIESIGTANKNFLLNEYAVPQQPDYILQENKNKGKLLLEDSQTNDTQLFSICTMNLIDFNYNEHVKDQAAVTAGSLAMRDNFMNVTDPIWRPDTTYRIVIKTKDALTSEGNKSYLNSYSFYFKTAGPIGHFHQHSLAYQVLAEKDKDQFRLATLNPYIDYSRSYPNADGRLINAKPLFYESPKLLMFYKQNTVHAMYNNFVNYGNNGAIISELRVLIKEPTGVLSDVEDYVTTISWKKNPDPMITPEIRLINNMAINVDNNCSGFEEFTPLSVVQEIETHTLRPDSLYTAIFNAVYKTETAQVHSYVFKTSQYENFKEQVQSYILQNENGEEKKAIFTVEKTFDTTMLNNASAILNGTYTGLMTEYANVFDRLTDGILKLGVLPPAITTDFNIIKDGNRIIGIIVRNPEPFNDPKIPDSDLSDTIQLAVGSTPASNYKVIFSQDKTQAFISNTALNIPTGDATFTFRYKEYGIDDTAKKYRYKTKDIETVTFGV